MNIPESPRALDKSNPRQGARLLKGSTFSYYPSFDKTILAISFTDVLHLVSLLIHPAWGIPLLLVVTNISVVLAQ
jgi:hypothetical protein